jgi:hypothetical protein
LTDSALRTHFEEVARDWAVLATTAAFQETLETEIIGRLFAPALPEEGSAV